MSLFDLIFRHWLSLNLQNGKNKINKSLNSVFLVGL